MGAHEVVIATHLIGALILGITSLSTLLVAFFQLPARRVWHIHLLGILSLVQVVTGTVLSIQAGESSIAYCSKIGIYLSYVIGIQLVLFIKRNESIAIKPLIYTHCCSFFLISIFLLSTIS